MLQSLHVRNRESIIVVAGAELQATTLFCGLLFVQSHVAPGEYELEDAARGEIISVALPTELGNLPQARRLENVTLRRV